MVQFFTDNDGEAVFRKEIVVPSDEAGKDMLLALGTLDDFDNTYFNGVEVGAGTSARPGGAAPRNYVVPGKLVKAGRNFIAVRLFLSLWLGRLWRQGGLASGPGRRIPP